MHWCRSSSTVPTTTCGGSSPTGLVLRLLRDNRAMSRLAFVEFDLEGMMDGEVHRLRPAVAAVPPVPGRGRAPRALPAAALGRSRGKRGHARARHRRAASERALRVLGTGFLVHPENAELRDRLSSGGPSPQELYRQLLRVVYRLLFLFVAEDRDVLLLPSVEGEPARAVARKHYQDYYSTRRLRASRGGGWARSTTTCGGCCRWSSRRWGRTRAARTWRCRA
jgi:hypothetical protein